MTNIDIQFEDYVDCDNTIISAYLNENNILDKIAGIYNKDLYTKDYNGDIDLLDYYNVNYYGIYDIYTKEFNVEIAITIYNQEELNILFHKYPETLNIIYEYTNNNIMNHYLLLSPEDKDMIFNEFKKYVCKDLSDIYPGNNFDEVIDTYINQELDMDRL